MTWVKDISAVVGCISGCIALLTILCKPLRRWIVAFIQRSSNNSKVEEELQEIKDMLERQDEADRVFREKMERSMDITLEFTEKQCRNIIKNIFERYKDAKILPLSEKKVLLDMEDLYINKLHKNHWGKTYIDEMKTWDVDTSDDTICVFDDET